MAGQMEPSPQDGHPSTAHYDEHGQYVHDPDNQPLAQAEVEGRTGAQPSGQYVHPFPSQTLGK
jgi:hypothetical protein